MKKYITLLAATLFAVGLFAAPAAPLTDAQQAVVTLYESRPKDTKTISTWVTANADAIKSAYAQVDSLPQKLAIKVTKDYIKLQNTGKQQGRYTVGAADAKKRAPQVYYTNFATADEIIAGAKTAALPSWYGRMKNRLETLGQTAKVEELNKSFLGKGVFVNQYQTWFIKYLSTLSSADKIIAIDNELRGLASNTATVNEQNSRIRLAWISNLATLKQVELLNVAPKTISAAFIQQDAKLRIELGLQNLSIGHDDPLYAPWRIAIGSQDVGALRQVYQAYASR